MHARVAAFENRDVSRLDELVRIVRDRAEGELPVPGALALLMLTDAATGRALGVSLFESEDALRAAEPAFERLGDEIPEELRGRRVSVEVYEVPIHEAAEGAAAARLTTLEAPADALDAMVERAERDVLPDLRRMDGWKGAIVLANRSASVAKLITLWDSAEALHASEQAADELRRRSTDEARAAIVGVERFDVPFAVDRAPTLLTR